MGRSVRCAVVALAVVAGLVTAGAAQAAVTNSTGTNVQSGNNRGTTNQGGSGKSGGAVGGQVTGVVSSGRTSVDAKNTSTNSDVTSGDVVGSNVSRAIVGLEAVHQSAASPSGPGAFASASAVVSNLQNGDNNLRVSQTADANSGDGVAGQVIGAVTSPGGSSSIVAANTTDNVDVTTGDAKSTNDSSPFVGLLSEASASALNAASASSTNVANCDGGPPFFVSCQPTQINSTTTAVAATATAVAAARNTQTGDNRATVSQSAPSTTGDGVAGQVIGAVSAGASSIDATNHSTNSSVETGDATSSNSASPFVGLRARASAAAANAFFATQTNTVTCSGNVACGGTQINAATVTATLTANSTSNATNDQTGNNRATVSQSAPATSGDGVAGEVIGAVTSPGGSSSIVAANTSDNVDVKTGDAKSTNTTDPFVGLDAQATSIAANIASASQTNSVTCSATFPAGVGCLPLLQRNAATVTVTATATSAANPTNTQTGDNRIFVSQSAPASSGDGVAGQVIGAVSAGASSIDATNRSTNSDVQTGDATSANNAVPFVGLRARGQSIDANVAIANQLNSVSCTGGSFGIHCNPTQTNVATVTATVSSNSSASPSNTQDGNNRATLSQSAPATSGDGVAGEVIGAVTSAGGRSSIVAANTSDNVDVTTGDARSTNDANTFVGLDALAGNLAVNFFAGSQTNVVNCAGNDNTLVECSPTQDNFATIPATMHATSTAAPANQQAGHHRATGTQSAPDPGRAGVDARAIVCVRPGSP